MTIDRVIPGGGEGGLQYISIGDARYLFSKIPLKDTGSFFNGRYLQIFCP
jgi:hypothetical protein